MSGVPSQLDVFHAVSDPTRRRLLDLLAEAALAGVRGAGGRDGEVSVLDLVRRFRVSQPAISRHLRILREAGLVRRRASGRRRYYSLRADELRQVSDWVGRFDRFWEGKLDELGEYMEKKP